MLFEPVDRGAAVAVPELVDVHPGKLLGGDLADFAFDEDASDHPDEAGLKRAMLAEAVRTARAWGGLYAANLRPAHTHRVHPRRARAQPAQPPGSQRAIVTEAAVQGDVAATALAGRPELARKREPSS